MERVTGTGGRWRGIEGLHPASFSLEEILTRPCNLSIETFLSRGLMKPAVKGLPALNAIGPIVPNMKMLDHPCQSPNVIKLRMRCDKMIDRSNPLIPQIGTDDHPSHIPSFIGSTAVNKCDLSIREFE
jgi:hypothetical protein